MNRRSIFKAAALAVVGKAAPKLPSVEAEDYYEDEEYFDTRYPSYATPTEPCPLSIWMTALEPSETPFLTFISEKYDASSDKWTQIGETHTWRSSPPSVYRSS